MVHLSDDIDQNAQDGSTQTASLTGTAATPAKVVKRKIPAPPVRPQPLVSVKETVVPVQKEETPPEEKGADATREPNEEKPGLEPGKNGAAEQRVTEPAETLSTQPKEPAAITAKEDATAADSPFPEVAEGAKRYAIQVGAFRTKAFAEERISVLNALGFTPYLFSATDSNGHKWYTVRLNRFETFEKTDQAMTLFHEKTDFPTAAVMADSLAPASKTVH